MPDRWSDDKLGVLDCFSGIGGFSLGLERAGGFKTKAFIEIDPFCRAVLKKHWPGVPQHDDIRTFDADGVVADLVCGGFPCQDIALPGSGVGIYGERSGLFWELWRIVRVVRPRCVLLENSPAILNRGLRDILGAMASDGYDAEWDCIPASVFGAHHNRNRWFCVAWDARAGYGLPSGAGRAFYRPGHLRQRQHDRRGNAGRVHRLLSTRMDSSDSNTASVGLEIRERVCSWRQEADAPATAFDWWENVPESIRVVDGVPNRAHRIRAIGNAVSPEVVLWIGDRIGRAIIEVEQCTTTTT